MNKTKPTEKQLAFMDWEFGLFFHFGIRSFFPGHRDWDDREMPASAFNPEKLNCDQWISTAKEAGAKYAILVTKHHDGFANWPSAYTDYSVKNTPWKNGEGDVVAEFVTSCRKFGLKVGLYYSPAQWGGINLKSEPDYDGYFINQISELLTNYGKIDYLWFDGNGSEGHEYDTERIISAIRSLQPEILIFNMWDPDTRWVGNEAGYADMPNRNTVSAVDFSTNTTASGEKDRLGEKKFLPAECDFMMRNTWFDDTNEDQIKSVEELVGIYELSVGRGANFLINIGPDKNGLLPEKDRERLLEFGKEIKKRYGTPIQGFSELKEFTDFGLKNSFCIEHDGNTLINRIMLSEDLSEGEGITEFKIYSLLPLYRENVICLYHGQTVGHKRICSFPTVSASKMIVEVVSSDGNFRLKEMKAFFVKE